MGSERGERAMGRRGSAPGWDEERRLQKQRDRRRGSPRRGVGACARRAVCPCTAGAHVCPRASSWERASPGRGSARGAGEHPWVPGPLGASPRQAPAAAAAATVP